MEASLNPQYSWRMVLTRVFQLHLNTIHKIVSVGKWNPSSILGHTRTTYPVVALTSEQKTLKRSNLVGRAGCICIQTFETSLRLFGGGGDDRGWNGWMASLTQWTWICVNSGSWQWTGRPGMLQSMGLQRFRHDWANELNWTWDNNT